MIRYQLSTLHYFLNLVIDGNHKISYHTSLSNTSFSNLLNGQSVAVLKD
ncbi:MAG: hypothetical protein LBU34_12275 [Planctomycetaceae bacterium]|nr:hypothetical protein [Planctomycetaceae bacterium]